MDNTPRKNATIDYLKFVSAVIVVFLHTVEQKKIAVTGLMHLVTQGFHYAIWLVNPVEIFLLTSGFYFFRSSYDFENNCFNSIKYKRKLKHYIMLYLVYDILINCTFYKSYDIIQTRQSEGPLYEIHA